MDSETYKVLGVLEDAKIKIEDIYNNAGYEESIDALDFMIIEENINRINMSISEIKNYSKGNLKSFKTTNIINIIEKNHYELLLSSRF